MRIPVTRETRHVTEAHLRTAIHPLRPDIPVGAITIEADDEGLMSAQIYGVEQALERSGEPLCREVVDRFVRWRATYDADELAALLATIRIIMPKAGVPIAPESLKLVELPDSVLVLTYNDRPVAASEDPLHLLTQAMLRLRAMRKQ